MLPPTVRRILAGSSLVLVAGLLPGLTPSASADDSSTLTVVGTSDVSDSNLVSTVIKPGFEAANPGLTLNYIGKGTGAAITFAEAGSASALLVHAASLENKFVGQGYSLESFGRAIFWGDYVLLGPASDPAHVMDADSNQNIVSAFQKIATAGADGDANFVSRGGTPGTTVQEHQIWKLTTGVPTCTVTDANGGGSQPSSDTGACPTLDAAPPAWYHATGQTQAPNIETGDVCPFGSGGANADNCYVFTDRGTFDFLQSTHALSNLQVVVDNNDGAPASQKFLLVNSFHAYGINPSAVPAGSQINTVAATKFLNWITSPAAQAAIGRYLQDTSGSAPFRPDAAPRVTASTLPKVVQTGGTVKLTGKVSNVVPGTPALNGVAVSLIRRVGTTTSVVDRNVTTANGSYTFSFKPQRTAAYSLVTPQIQKTEIALSPVFADLLAPTSTKLSTVKVQSHAVLRTARRVAPKRVEVTGRVSPRVAGSGAVLQLWAARPGRGSHLVAHTSLPAGAAHFDKRYPLPKGRWQVKVRYVNSGVVLPDASGSRGVR